MKALIIDPALRTMGGHHHNAVRCLLDELAKLSAHTACLGSAYAEPDVVRALGCTPCFSRSVYGRTYAAAGEFISAVKQTRHELAHAMDRKGKVPDLLVLPCCDQVLAAAVAQCFKRRLFGARPHILLWLLYAPHYKRPPDDPLALPLRNECRSAFASLKSAVGGDARIRAFCETPALAEFYRRLMGFDVRVMPTPGLVRRRSRLAHQDGQPPTVVCIGFANRPKGYRLLPDAVAEVLQQHPNARFLVHGIVEGSDAEEERWVFDRLLSFGERVSVRQDVLTQQEYQACLDQADFLLLPYDPDVYGSRGSGVFTEARTLGIPVIATQGCGFAQPAFDEGWGVPIGSYSSMGVAQAILAALARQSGLAEQAHIAASRTRDDLEGVLRTAVDRLWADRSAGLRGMLRRLVRPPD